MITAGDLVRAYARAIDRRDWKGLAALLGPGFTCEFAHTGERFDAEAFVALNRDYPGGPWRFRLLDVVDAGSRAAALAEVTDASGGPETHRVAILASLEDDLIAEITELWSEVTPPDPERRPD